MTVTAVLRTRNPDPDVDRRVRRDPRADLGPVGRSAQARALVGSADLSGHLHGTRPDPGGHVAYHMTGPAGDQPRGYWDVVEVEPPNRLVYIDGFAGDDGSPNEDFPRIDGIVTIEPIEDGRSRMTVVSRFPSTEALEQMLAMGMEEGFTEAIGQIDAILAEGVAA